MMLRSIRARLRGVREGGRGSATRRLARAPRVESLEGRQLLSFVDYSWRSSRLGDSEQFGSTKVAVVEMMDRNENIDLMVEVTQNGRRIARFPLGEPGRDETLPDVSINMVGRQLRYALAYQSVNPSNPNGDVRIRTAVYDIAGRQPLYQTWTSAPTGVNSDTAEVQQWVADQDWDHAIWTRPSISLGDRGRWAVAYVVYDEVNDTTNIVANRFTPNTAARAGYTPSKTYAITRSLRTLDKKPTLDMDSRPNVRIHSSGNFAVAYEYFSDDSESIDTGTVVVRDDTPSDPPQAASDNRRLVNETQPSISTFDGDTASIVVQTPTGARTRGVRYRR